MAVQAVANMRNGEPVSWPTALKIPPQVPLIQDGGAVGGSRGAEPAPWAATATSGARATANGVTATLARRLQRAARPCSRGPAAMRPTCHQAQRLARRSSGPELTSVSGGPAPGMPGGRGDDLARAQHTGAELAERSARAAGQFVKRASETEGGHVPVTALSEPAIPGHGKGRPRRPAGAPGLLLKLPTAAWLFARGMEARQGRDAVPLTAARCAARQPGPAQRRRAHRIRTNDWHHINPARIERCNCRTSKSLSSLTPTPVSIRW